MLMSKLGSRHTDIPLHNRRRNLIHLWCTTAFPLPCTRLRPHRMSRTQESMCRRGQYSCKRCLLSCSIALLLLHIC